MEKISSAISPLNNYGAADKLSNDKSQLPKSSLEFDDALRGQLQNIEKAEQALDSKLKAQSEAQPFTLKFSNHAVERMSQRGIRFSPDQMAKIENAARKASEKGSKETLIMADDSALIVSLKNNTIVTVMDKSALKENVFTNIDSTVVV